MISDLVKTGFEKVGPRGLFKAAGLCNEDLEKPLIGVVNSFNEIVPGHVHLNDIASKVKLGVAAAEAHRSSSPPSRSAMVSPWATAACVIPCPAGS